MTEHPHAKLLKATESHRRMHTAVSEAAAAMREQLEAERQQRADQEAQEHASGPGQ